MERPSFGTPFDAAAALRQAQSDRLPLVAGGMALLLAVYALALLYFVDADGVGTLARMVALTAVILFILAEAWRRWPPPAAVAGPAGYLLVAIMLLLASWHALRFDMTWSPAAAGLALVACGAILIEPLWFGLGVVTVLGLYAASWGRMPAPAETLAVVGTLVVALVLALGLRHGQANAAVRRARLRWQERDTAERLAQAEESTRNEARRRHAADVARLASLAYQDWLAAHAQEVLFRIDEEGQILAVTPTAPRLLGRSDQDLLTSNFFEAIHPEDRPRIEAQRRPSTESDALASHLCRWLRPFAEDAWISVRWHPVPDQDPVREWTAVVSDGTAEHRCQRLQERLDALDLKLRQKDEEFQREALRRREVDSALEEAAETIHQLRQKCAELDDVRRQTVADTEQEREQWLAEAARLREQRDQLAAQCRNLEHELGQVRRQAEQQQARIRELQEQVGHLQQQLAQYRQRESQFQEQEQNVAQRLAAVKEQEPRWQQELARVNLELDRLRLNERQLTEAARTAREELAAARAELRAWQSRPAAVDAATWQPVLDELNQLRAVEADLRRQHDQLLIELRRAGDRSAAAPPPLAAAWEWELSTGAFTASPECKALLGSPPHENPPNLTTLCHADDVPALREALRLHREHRLPLAVEVRLRRHTGEYAWMLLRGQIRDSANGPPDRLVGTLTDVSTVKRLEGELLGLRQALQRSEHQRDTFLAQLDQEVRTPLAALAGYVDMLLDPQLPAPERPVLLRGVQRHARQLDRVVRDLHDLADLDSGRVRATPTEVTPWPILREVFDELAPLAVERQVTLRVLPLGPMPRRLHTDPERLRHLLRHLGGHALHATAKGEVVLRAAVEAGVEGTANWWRLEVVDQGGGLAPEVLRVLSQSPVRAAAPVAESGGDSVLGLMLSHRLARLLGGELGVQNQPGQGTCFTLRLPLAEAEAANLIQVGALDSTVDRAPAKAKRRPQLAGRVLLGETNRDVQRVLQYVLERAGLRVDVVDHGRDALEQAQAGQHAALLLSTRLSEVNGYTVARQLRLHQDRRPLVALYHPSGNETEAHCREAGFDLALSQPVDPDRLLAALQAVLPPPGLSDSAPPLPLPEAAPPEHEAADAILSTHHHDPAMMHMVREYVAGLPARLAEFRAALRTADLARIIKLAHQTKNAAAQYGYPALSEAAALLQTAVAEGQEASLLADLLEELTRLAHRVQKAFG